MRYDCRGKGPMQMLDVIEEAAEGDILVVDSEEMATLGNQAADRWSSRLTFEVEPIPDDASLSAFGGSDGSD